MALTALRLAAIAAVVSASLAACGTGRENPIVVGVLDAMDRVTDARGAAGATTPVLTAATVPPELVAALPGPLMLVELPSFDGSTGMTRVGQNGTVETWRGPNGLGLARDQHGVLISTRGFGFDLMSSNTAATSAALSARRAGAVARAMIHLDGEARPQSRIYQCQLRLDGPDTIAIAGTMVGLTNMTEHCQGQDGYRFENLYWLDRAGRAVHSRQWISPEIGTATLTLLRP